MKPKLADNTWQDWVNAFNEGLKAMMEAGEAQRGDRTMVDALVCGQDYLRSVTSRGEFSWYKFHEAIRKGADHAKTLPGGKGRSG